ncbi:hypothetical protein M9H77_31258 [Catharanthus roseus]|uniref:Uncharacterized protein n=1 Tax=Catharanthus roseus TaxID=4058 RepID=A0ACB9ZZY2_CATRO|nr:hypothetical protein M9H77_31258 [Catharanthus roseus]
MKGKKACRNRVASDWEDLCFPGAISLPSNHMMPRHINSIGMWKGRGRIHGERIYLVGHLWHEGRLDLIEGSNGRTDEERAPVASLAAVAAGFAKAKGAPNLILNSFGTVSYSSIPSDAFDILGTGLTQ